MHVKSLPLQHYVNRIKADKPFSFVRYGDGEWSAITGDRRRRTGSGSHSLIIPQMCQDLRRSVREHHQASNYVMSLRTTAMKPVIRRWIHANAPLVAWHDCTVFYKNSRKGRLYPFIEAVRESDLPVIVVGPPWLRKLNNKVFKLATFIDIPARDCYRKKKQILKRVLAFDKPAIISVSAGPPAKVMVYELYRRIGQHSFIFDLGSLWDVYCGKRSRRYQKRMTAETIRRNLNGQ